MVSAPVSPLLTTLSPVLCATLLYKKEEFYQTVFIAAAGILFFSLFVRHLVFQTLQSFLRILTQTYFVFDCLKNV